jgi:acetyltransferase-like isoleucine patch superfamily enzyme
MEEVLQYYGRSGTIAKLEYGICFVKNFILESLANMCPYPPIRTICHKLRGVKIGHDVFIGNHVLLDRVYPDLITIGDHTSIGDRSMIMVHAAIPSNSRLRKIYPRKVSPIRIGTGVWIAPGAIVLQGVTIGEEAVVGAGSLVLRDVPPHTVVGGVPARVIKEIPPESLER